MPGFDLDGEKVRSIEQGASYIEDVSSEDVQKMRAEGRLGATTDFSELTRLDVINICVPTPLTRSKDPDVSHMAKAVEDIRKRLRSGS